MQALRAIRDWVMPVNFSSLDFLRLSQACVEEINDRVRSSNILNESQCGDLLSKLAETIDNVRALVSNCGDPSTPFMPALRNLSKISEKAKRLVSNCSNENWREASLIFQSQNDEAFQEILLEMGLCYNVICEQAKGMRGKRDPQIPDLRESSTFSPATEEKVREDRELLQKILERLASTTHSSNSWEIWLAKYLLRKLDCPPQHGHANELDSSTSPILWVKETEPPGTWQLDSFLGGGSGASGVCSTQWLGIPCAKKEFHTAVEMAIFVREVGILSRLSHPNIVNFFCCSNGPEKGQCYIGMELMQMSLSDLIQDEAKKGRKPFPVSVALDIIVQIARGMCYLHDFGIAHRDLKPSNVVVSRLITPHLDDNFCAKLVDFGMSKTKVEVSKSNTISIPGVGTTRYRAPEVHPKAQNPKQGDKGQAKVVWSKADVYSFGVTCAEILSLETPFKDVELSTLYRKLVKGQRPELPSHCPGKLVSLLEDCWNGAPRSRPTFIEICTRLEVVRHDLLRDSTSVAHGGSQEVIIDPIGYNYIEEMLRKYEHQRRNQSPKQPNNLHLVGLDQEDAISDLEQALERFQGFVYPQNDPDPVTIRQEDMRTLNPLEFLNDTIIDFYNKERTNPQEKKILAVMQAEVTRSKMLVGSGRGTPPLETHHGEVGPSMREYEHSMASTSGLHDTLLQIPYLLIKDPKTCQTTTIPLPYGIEGIATLRPSWQMLCEGVNISYGCQDCKDGKDSMRIVEATSTSMVICDVLNSQDKPKYFKAWSPPQNIKENIEDEIFCVLLHPNLNIVFWATRHGVLGAYDFQSEELIGIVHLPQRFKPTSLIFSIALNMLVVSTYSRNSVFLKEELCTWTLHDEQVKRVGGIGGLWMGDLHNDQVRLLVHNWCSLAIYDLQQRKELHRWTYEDGHCVVSAKYSCDSQLVYAVFRDSSIGVFDATCLQLRCRITPSAYAGRGLEKLIVSSTNAPIHPEA